MLGIDTQGKSWFSPDGLVDKRSDTCYHQTVRQMNYRKIFTVKQQEVWWGGKKSENIQRSYVMNTTLSQNVIVITYNGMLPTNKTERVQL